jgi:hypothetical protein
MSDNPYDNIESWQYRWAKWGRYAHMTPSEIHDETYKGGHSTEAYNGQSYLTTMAHIALMRRLGKEPYIVLPDNSNMLAKLVELGFAVHDDDAIECVPDEDDDQVIEAYRGPPPDRERVDPIVFEIDDSLLDILRDDDDDACTWTGHRGGGISDHST